MIYTLWKRICCFLSKLNICLSYDLKIMLFGIYPNKLKTCDHTKRCTQVFIAAVFIIAKICNQPKCPSVGKWINTPVYIKAMEYYSIFPILLFIIYYIIYIIYYIGYIYWIYIQYYLYWRYIYIYIYIIGYIYIQ